LATAGIHPYVRKHLVTKISHDNAATIVDYMLAKNSEISLSDNYRRDNILTLKKLDELIKNKPFKYMQHQDIITFLDQRDILQNKKEKSELIY
jgi:hypothetical protein